MIEKKIDEFNKDEDNVIEFKPRLATDAWIPDETCWLKTLGLGTIFLCQRKNQAQEFGIYMLAVNSITPKKQMYGLINVISGEPWPHPGLINPVRFCNYFELVEVVRNHEEYLAEKELNDERDRANQPEGLEGHAEPQSISKTDEESQS